MRVSHATRPERATAAAAGLVLPLLAGCAVGPDYAPPEPEAPDHWHVDATRGLSLGQSNLQTWWTLLADPLLPGLIESAYQGSYDLQQAVARVDRARAGLGVARGARVPQVDGVGVAQRQRFSDDIGTSNTQNPQDLFQLGVDSSWELDLWGRVRRSVESAAASYEASVEDYRDTLVVLFADVATSYVDVRTFQERLRYARNNARNQRGSLSLTRDRRDAGLVGDLDVRQAQLNLARTEARIPFLEQRLAESIHRLGVLTGQLPRALYQELSAVRPIPQPPREVVLGLPADLLRQRPDIRQAERELAAATAGIGVATAELYPAFSLTGTFTVDATSVSDLFQWSSRAFGIGPTLRWNLFAGGRVRSQIQSEEARTQEALGIYEQTVLEAYEEVENALVAFVREQERRDYLQESVDAAREAVRLVNVLYRQGLTEFQNVLDTELLLFDQEDDLAESRGEVTRNLIRIYRSLGGGWAP